MIFIPIIFRIKYKNYPNAPKATRKSHLLGLLFSLPVLLLLAFIWLGAVGNLLYLAIDNYAVAGVIAIVTGVPVGFLLFRWKKKREQKIDGEAADEATAFLAMSAEERAALTEKERKNARVRTGVILGVSLLFLVGLVILLAMDQ